MNQAEVAVVESYDGNSVEIIRSEEEVPVVVMYLTIEEVVELIPKLEKIASKSLGGEKENGNAK